MGLIQRDGGWDSGTCFLGKVATPLHCNSSSLFPGTDFFSFCPWCHPLSGVLQPPALSLLPCCNLVGTNTIRKGEVWALLLSVPSKNPQGKPQLLVQEHKQIHLVRFSLITWFLPLAKLHQMLPQISRVSKEELLFLWCLTLL